MNTQRFVWAATALLFALVGAMLGYVLGQLYVQLPLVRSSKVEAYIPFTLALGLGIVAARFGSFIADRFLLPSMLRLADLSVADRVLGVSGALMGLLFGVLVTLPIENSLLWLPIKFCIMAVCAALGMSFFEGMRTEMLRVFPQLEEEQPAAQTSGIRPKFLDTNIIIDGRLADLCQTGFIDGPIYVPSFVLEEVQHVADSSDSLRRARGRRGLDILNEMKELTVPQTLNGQVELVSLVHVLNEIPPAVQKISAVDSKLVALAREKGGVIITNDFNLNKVAELQGVQVLNLNELAQALKPVVLPGEEMQVTIVKEGKESHQGVGYLEDGTMVVVGDGINHIGETLSVTISSVYQTVAGKMIFADMKEDASSEKESRMKGAGDDLFENSSNGNGNGRHDSKSEGRSSRHDDFGHRSGGGVRRKSRTER